VSAVVFTIVQISVVPALGCSVTGASKLVRLSSTSRGPASLSYSLSVRIRLRTAFDTSIEGYLRSDRLSGFLGNAYTRGVCLRTRNSMTWAVVAGLTASPIG